jgi:hypothetical protein
LQELVDFAAMAVPPAKPAAAIIFPVIAAYGFWVSGVAVLAVLGGPRPICGFRLSREGLG